MIEDWRNTYTTRRPHSILEWHTRAAYAKTTKSDTCFYVRTNSTTRMLEGPDIASYVDTHWQR